jgi:hypothetical protein
MPGRQGSAVGGTIKGIEFPIPNETKMANRDQRSNDLSLRSMNVARKYAFPSFDRRSSRSATGGLCCQPMRLFPHRRNPALLSL